MNSYKYKKNNIAFDNRLKEIALNIKREFKNGNIKTETDYAYTLNNKLKEFYKKMGKPMFELHLASDVPSLPHYIDMVSRAKLDMEILVEGCKSISQNIKVYETEMNDTMKVLSNRTNMIMNNIENLERKINSIRNAKSILYSDVFDSNNNTHRETSIENSSFADTSTGMLILPPVVNKPISDAFNVKILQSSNGFPGNTHEVYNSIDSVFNSNIKYKGENDPHIDLDVILNSSTSESWFEFELYNLDEEVINKTSMIGFNYKEGISWVTGDNCLKLDLLFYTENPVKMNYINLIGMPKPNTNVSGAIVKTVTISDDITGIQTITVNKELVDNMIITFNTQDVKSIKVELEQRESVLTKVCRDYAINVDPTRISHFVNDEYKGYMQVDIPSQSIEYLGLKYNQQTSSFIYPDTKTKNNFINKEYLKSKLFYSINPSSNYKMQSEIVDAYRYSISLKQIDMKYRTYKESSVYISKDFVSEEPLKTLTLNSEDYIPHAFNKDEDLLKYFISFDNGAEWHEIYPRHKSHLGPCSIVVNSNVAIANRNKNINYVDMLTDPYSFKVKIEMKRHSEIVDETPIVYAYYVDVSSEEDIW